MSVESDITELQNQVRELALRTELLNQFSACVNSVLACGDDSFAKFAFIADAGTAGANQTLVANLILDDDPVALFAGGDNNYPSGSVATIEANWAAFGSLVTLEKVYPALGNHDLDTANGQAQIDKFSYLPGNRRYYSKFFENEDLEIFVLNSGLTTAGALVEADGNDIGSVQWEWFQQAVIQSTARWKVVMFHHPAISYGTKNALIGQMHWPFASLGIDLVLQGHQHINEHLYVKENTLSGCHYIQATSMNPNGTYHQTAVQHANYTDDRHCPDFSEYNGVWKDAADTDPNEEPNDIGYWRINVSSARMIPEFINSVGQTVYAFQIRK